jgi:hypothetical protein
VPPATAGKLAHVSMQAVTQNLNHAQWCFRLSATFRQNEVGFGQYCHRRSTSFTQTAIRSSMGVPI